MGKLCLVIGDKDENYLKHLGDYLMIHHSGRFSIHLFSSPSNLGLFLNAGKRPDILLLSYSFPRDNLELMPGQTKIELTEDNTFHLEEKTNKVFKYKHTESLVQDILHIHSKSTLDEFAPEGKKTARIYAVHSASGGAGCTTIAVGLSMLAARRKLKPFYLCLESTASTSFYFKGKSERSFSDVIYYLKERGINLSAKLEGACCSDPASGVSYFLPPDSACELEEFTMEDLELLFGTLQSLPLYDIIIIDLPPGLSRRNNHIFKFCDKVINVYSYGLSIYKNRLMADDPGAGVAERKNELSLKTIGILNRYNTNILYDRYQQDYHGKPALTVAESERLKLDTGERLLIDMDMAFTSSIGKLLDILSSGSDESMEGGAYA